MTTAIDLIDTARSWVAWLVDVEGEASVHAVQAIDALIDQMADKAAGYVAVITALEEQASADEAHAERMGRRARARRRRATHLRERLCALLRARREVGGAEYVETPYGTWILVDGSSPHVRRI